MPIAFRSDLDVETTEFKITGNKAKAEIISVVLTSSSGKKVCISTLYRVDTLGVENFLEVDRHLRSIALSKSVHSHILLGDFNLNKTKWPDGQSTCGIESRFINLFSNLGFDQLMNEPTHKYGNILDLLLCNRTDMVDNVSVLPRNTICNSVHFGIKFTLKFDCKRLRAPKRKIYNLKKADFKSINAELLAVPWDDILRRGDPNFSLEKFESIFSHICDRFIPKVTAKSSFQPPWFDSELDSICKKKRQTSNQTSKNQ